MKNVNRLFAMLLTVCFVVFAIVQIHYVGAATTRNFTLYGSISNPAGWGFTEGNLTSPGPLIEVEQGDTVNLTLISKDGAPHRFWLSYTNGSSPQQGDPLSPDFSTTVNYNFTVTNAIGTYRYECAIHDSAMYGYLKVVPTGTIPEFQPAIMLAMLVAGTMIAAFVYKGKKQIGH
jgi:FtsP/CotA-like multicopper oxidase with cupredoxin domain